MNEEMELKIIVSPSIMMDASCNQGACNGK